MFASAPTEPRPLARFVFLILPAAGAVALLTLVGLRGPRDPLALAATAVAIVLAMAVALRRFPAIIWSLAPIGMSVFLVLPVQLYDVVILGLAALIFFAWVGRTEHPIRLDRVEVAYLIFMACIAITLLGPFDPRHLFVSVWMFGMGLVAFEVARRGAMRIGRVDMLWGPLLFAALTAVMLVSLARHTGSATSLLSKHRTELTNLTWGSTNYVAAVLVLLLPGVLLIARDPRASATRHRIGSIGVAMVLGALALSTSRGGLLLGVVYVLVVNFGSRRGFQAMAAGVLALLVLLFATPFGALVVARFTNPEEMMSVAIRFDIWHAAWERGVTHLPFGVGFGQGAMQNDKLGDYDPHDFYLTLFGEGGPLALVLWLGLIVVLWRAAARLRTRVPERAAGEALRDTIALTLLNAAFEPTFSGHLYYVLFWWMAGIFEAGAGRMSTPVAPRVIERAVGTSRRLPGESAAPRSDVP